MMKSLLRTCVIFSALLPLTSHADEGKNVYGLGIEGFKDTYKESDNARTDTSRYGSITGYYSRQYNKGFLALDGRMSYGTKEYKAGSGSVLADGTPVDGKATGVPQWEWEFRGRIGYSTPLWGGSLSPYTGLGLRYFRDEAKNYYTDSSNSLYGANPLYDRRTLHVYLPIGASYSFATEDGWTITPQLEGDVLLYGNSDTRMTNHIGGYGPSSYVIFYDPQNNGQNRGIGARGELMFGKDSGNYSWEIGPFIRYWHIGTSKTVTYIRQSTGAPDPQKVPANDRTQIGIAARVLW